MVNIRISGLPDDVVATLRRQASASGQPLHEYVRDRLIAGGRRPDPADSTTFDEEIVE